MPQLRWALTGLGLLFLLGLVLWEWRRSRRAPARSRLPEASVADITLTMERPRRIEPDLGDVVGVFAPRADDSLEVPVIHPVEPITQDVPVAAGSAVDVPAAARGASGAVLAQPLPARAFAETDIDAAVTLPPGVVASPVLQKPVEIRWPPAQSERVLSLRVLKHDGAPLPGRALRISLEAAGLVNGPQNIYHRADPDGAVIVSAANLVRPGTLDPAHMDAAEFRGLSLFSVLPGPLPPVRMLEELVATARSVSQRLGAVVQDERGAGLDGTRLVELRRSLEGGDAAGGTP